MDNLNAISDSILASCFFSDSFPDSLGLCNVNDAMVLPMPDDSGGRCDPLVAAQTKIFCRSALEWMLKSVDIDNAQSWATRLIDNFGSLANTLATDINIIADTLDGDLEPAIYIYRMHRVFLHVIKCKIRSKCLVGCWNELIEYLQIDMGQLRVEKLRVIFLDRSQSMIGDEIMNVGNVSEVQCYPRQVARRAVVLNASAAILVHNHPSGDPRMSSADKSMTYAVAEACRAVGVVLHDHLVICRDKYSSFRSDNPLWARSA